MDSDRWRQLQDWFAAARATPPAEREAFLAARAVADPDLAAQLRALLVADELTGIMDAWAPQLASVAQVIEPAAPAHVGAYRIVSEIGRGGMGTVYLADRAGADFEHRVAIKLIGTSDADDPLHQRFLAERRILAGLVHPNIARLLDGGVTDDGRPYLVMELVDGLPITEYCADRNLDIPARLRLFADVCAAIQHAHQNLVIHRDLKPSNILISGDGHVHLFDFGIAKLIDPARTVTETRVESRMMTPAYASPEQVKGEALGTTSDIYSLGVLLYELLCGSPPYEFPTTSPLQVAAFVCEQDPPPPSARVAATDRHLAHLLGGDLDSIVLMAMRKEPARRYASADMLRQDVERHLAGLPVLAHRGSRRYRLQKFLRRHRVEAAAAAIVLVALVAGLSVAVTQGQRAARERDRAERALAESKSVTEFLLELFRTGEPGDRPAAQLTALDLLQRGAVRADDLSTQPIVQARLLDVIRGGPHRVLVAPHDQRLGGDAFNRVGCIRRNQAVQGSAPDARRQLGAFLDDALHEDGGNRLRNGAVLEVANERRAHGIGELADRIVELQHGRCPDGRARADEHEPADTCRSVDCDPLGDEAAHRMADDRRAPHAECVEKRQRIGGEVGGAIAALGPFGVAVSALGGDDGANRRRQPIEHGAEREPGVGEAVQEQHRLAVGGAAFGDLEGDARAQADAGRGHVGGRRGGVGGR
jgi:serine/threonine protein kinase